MVEIPWKIIKIGVKLVVLASSPWKQQTYLLSLDLRIRSKKRSIKLYLQYCTPRLCRPFKIPFLHQRSTQRHFHGWERRHDIEQEKARAREKRIVVGFWLKKICWWVRISWLSGRRLILLWKSLAGSPSSNAREHNSMDCAHFTHNPWNHF